MWLNSGVEGLLTVVSLIGAVLHYRAAEKKFSRVTKFHLIHWLFCLWLTMCGLIWVTQQKNDNYTNNYCSVFNNLWNVGECVLFAITWYIFAEYWEQVLANSKERRQALRATVMGILAVACGVTYVWPNLGGEKHCKRYTQDHKEHFAFVIVAYSVYPLVMAADALRLGFICYKRIYDVASTYPTFSRYNAVFQAKYYFGLSISFVLAPMFYNLDMPRETHWTTGQFFMFVVPGVLMVAATWRRNYLTVSRDTISTGWSCNYDDDGHESNRSLGGVSSKGGGFGALEDARASALLLPPGASSAKSDVPIHFLIPRDEAKADTMDSNASDVENPVVGAGYIPPRPRGLLTNPASR